MPIGQVLEKSFSKGGKLKLKIQTSDGPPKWRFMPEGVDGDALLGKRIDFEAGQFSFTDQKTGKTVWMDTVKNWAPVAETPIPSPPVKPPEPPKEIPPGQYGSVTIAAPGPAQRALSTLFDHELRFISNVVGQAIYAGACKEPKDVLPWFHAARDALTMANTWQVYGDPEHSLAKSIEDALSPKDRGNQTKSANAHAQRILDAVRVGNDRLTLELWDEASYLKTSTEYEAAVFAALPTTVQNRVKDLADASYAAAHGHTPGIDSEVGF
jgi:hypothetical protein